MTHINLIANLTSNTILSFREISSGKISVPGNKIMWICTFKAEMDTLGSSIYLNKNLLKIYSAQLVSLVLRYNYANVNMTVSTSKQLKYGNKVLRFLSLISITNWSLLDNP